MLIMRLRLNEIYKISFISYFIGFIVVFCCLFCFLSFRSFCASGQAVYSAPPYPVGDGYGYNSSQEELFNQAVSEILALRPDVQLIYCCSFTDSNYAYFNGVYGLSDITITGALNSGFSRATYTGSAIDGFIWSNGSIVQTTYYPGSPTYCQLSDYTLFNPDNPNFVYLIKNQFIPGYPLYISPNVDKSVYNDCFFVKSGSSGIGVSGGASGSITSPGGDSSDLDLQFDLLIDDSALLDKLQEILDSNLSQEDKLDSIITLLSSANGKYDSIISYLQGSNNSLATLNQKLDLIYGKLVDSNDNNKSWLEKIYRWLVDFGSVFALPDPEDVQEVLENSTFWNAVTDLINFAKTFKNQLSLSNVTPKNSSNVDFYYDFHWNVYNFDTNTFEDKVTTVFIQFSWFESIRTPVTLVLTVFLILGMASYFVHQLVNLINGSGSGVNFVSAVRKSKGGEN